VERALVTRIVYLHGFASSPGSSKARFFAGRFSERGIPIEIPQLDEGDFERLTITSQLNVIHGAVGGRPAILMGSSLGGYLAALYASAHPEIERLILMAPALRFPSRWRERYAADLERWEGEGALPFFHFGHQGERRLGYQFVADAAQYPDEPEFRQPALILHGLHDPVVPAAISEDYSRSHPNVRLQLYDSGHELTDVLDLMWGEITSFLGLTSVPKPVAL
jgi:uncharacterized protein